MWNSVAFEALFEGIPVDFHAAKTGAFDPADDEGQTRTGGLRQGYRSQDLPARQRGLHGSSLFFPDILDKQQQQQVNGVRQRAVAGQLLHIRQRRSRRRGFFRNRGLFFRGGWLPVAPDLPHQEIGEIQDTRRDQNPGDVSKHVE